MYHFSIASWAHQFISTGSKFYEGSLKKDAFYNKGDIAYNIKYKINSNHQSVFELKRKSGTEKACLLQLLTIFIFARLKVILKIIPVSYIRICLLP